jgi:two-component system, cell cycle response regulator DivK
MKLMDAMCVLIVEDDARNAALTIAMLSIVGIQNENVYVCKSGREIMDVVAKMALPDLVLLDLQLPGEDGFQILERLRRTPIFKDVPICAMTAQVMPDEVNQAERAGFDGFLGKPLNFDRFPEQIRDLLERKRVWDPR